MLKNIFEKVYTERDLGKLKNFIARDFNLYSFYSTNSRTPTNAELSILFEKRLQGNLENNLNEKRIQDLKQLLKNSKVRSNSGVVTISVLTKPYPCPGRCIYCPTEVKMPKSYLSQEPVAARGLANNFDPFKQMHSRLKSLELNGHPIDKLEVIVIGGTFDYYEKSYQEFFMQEIFRAANEYNFEAKKKLEIKNKSNLDLNSLTLLELQKINETAKCRIVGLSVETRPDWINFEELNWLRYLGVTKIEIGVQHLDNQVLDFNGRDMTREKIAEATELMRAAGFKFVYHMMPNLPESNAEMDVQMFKDLYNTKDFHPDMLKIYPCVILKTTLLYKMFTRKIQKVKNLITGEYQEKEFSYQPYTDEKLIKVLAGCEREVKNYTRIIRMIRDIPATYILASSKKSNLRELVDAFHKKENFFQQDIRARQIRDTEVNLEDFSLRQTIYQTNHGKEYFLEYINIQDKDKIAGFVRLRLQDDFFDSELSKYENLKNLTDKTAVIRELHVYGKLKKIGEEGNQVQHLGFGKKLMLAAEKIAKENNYKKIAVISGVGVRKYYEKLGYHLENTYMVKYL